LIRKLIFSYFLTFFSLLENEKTFRSIHFASREILAKIVRRRIFNELTDSNFKTLTTTALEKGIFVSEYCYNRRLIIRNVGNLESFLRSRFTHREEITFSGERSTSAAITQRSMTCLSFLLSSFFIAVKLSLSSLLARRENLSIPGPASNLALRFYRA